VLEFDILPQFTLSKFNLAVIYVITHIKITMTNDIPNQWIAAGVGFLISESFKFWYAFFTPDKARETFPPIDVDCNGGGDADADADI
jgi:hypothetical protein